MRDRLWLVVTLALGLALAGCPSDDDDDATGDDDVTGDDDDATDDDDDVTDDDDDTAPPVEPYIVGALYDVTGAAPLDGVRVTFCQTQCMFQDTDADGVYLFDGLEAGEGVFDIIGHVNPDAALYASLVADIEVPASGFAEVPDVWLPEISSLVAVASGSHDVDLGDDLTLTLDADAMDWPLGAAEAGAVEVPEDAWPGIDLEGYEILGVWALFPWAATILQDEDPVAVSLPVRGDVTGDPEFTVFSMSTEEHGFVEVATAGVDGDRVVTAPGSGLTELTWVAYGLPM